MKDLNAGIWIDREHATVVLVSADANELEKFQVSDPEPFPETQASRAKHDYTRNDFVAEDKLGRKKLKARLEMYELVLQYVAQAETLFVLGPGEAKKEFQRHLASLGHVKHVIDIESSDKMTDPQLVAKVREHFQLSRKALQHD